MPNLFSFLRGNRFCRDLFTIVLVFLDHDQHVADVDSKELETLDPLHFSPVDVNGSLLGPLFPIVHDQLLCLAHIEEEVVVLALHCQVCDLFPIGCLIVVGDHCFVIRKLNDGVGVVLCPAETQRSQPALYYLCRRSAKSCET